jgi:hypothetical protein
MWTTRSPTRWARRTRRTSNAYAESITACAKYTLHRGRLMHATIEPPPDATQLDQWHPSGTGRGFIGTTRRVDRAEPDDTIAVVVSGVQYSRDGGRTERWIFVRDASGPMTPPEARQLARALMGAVDEIDARGA